MVWPGPSSRASRIAPAMLMPVEPPTQSPSSWIRSKTIGSASSSGIWKEKSGVNPSRLAVMRPCPMPSVIELPSDFRFAAGVEAVERRAQRIGERDLDVLALGLQPEGDAGQRAAGADRRDETVDLAAGLGPDLLRRGADMAVAVGDIVELVGPDRAVRLGPRHLLGQAARQFHVVVGVLVRHRRHLDQLGAEQSDRVLLLLALRIGNDDHGAVAERLGDQRQADAGIAGRALDDDAARLQQPALFGVADDEQAGAVLDRLARIHELGLAQDLAAGFFRGLVEADQGRVADRVDHRTGHPGFLV